MGLAKLDITLDIQNNTDYPQEISVLGNPYNPLDTVNATREFRWNLTGFTFTTENYLSLQYRGINQTVFTAYISGLASQSLQSILTALNGLNIGYFNLYTELGQTYIGTYNQNVVFGDLNIYNASNSEMSFNNLTTFNPLFSIIVLTLFVPPAIPNAILVTSGDNSVYSLSTNGTPPLPSFSISTNTVGTANSYLEIIENGIVVYSQFGTSFTFSSTTLIPPNQYTIVWRDNP